MSATHFFANQATFFPAIKSPTGTNSHCGLNHSARMIGVSLLSIEYILYTAQHLPIATIAKRLLLYVFRCDLSDALDTVSNDASLFGLA